MSGMLIAGEDLKKDVADIMAPLIGIIELLT